MEKIALITGGSKGIGKALAEEFAKHGYNLILVSRSQEALLVAQQAIQQRYSCEVKILSADLGTSQGRDLLMTTFKDELGQVEVLVNNAGFNAAGIFTDMPLSTANDMIALNVIALTDLTYAFLKIFKSKNKGMILNIASTAGFAPGPNMAVYYATKAYVITFSTALYDEYAKDGITVSTLCPGATGETDFFITAHAANSGVAKMSKFMKPDAVAKIGFAGLMKKKRLIVPGFMNKFFVLSMKLSPNWLVAKIIGSLNKPSDK